jgi:hypothetical protein
MNGVKELAKRLPNTVLVIRPYIIDLECCGMFELEKGRTYYNDGTTVFDAYIEGGIASGSLVEAKRDRNTITISANDLLRA